MADLVMRRRIAAPPATVFSFLIEPEKLLRWLGVQGDIDPTVGGRVRIDVTGGDVVEGTYLAIEAPHRVSFTWGWTGHPDVPPASTTVTFDLEPDGDGTALTLTHAGLPAGVDDEHAVGWTYFLARLPVAVSGEEPGPVDLADLADLTPILEET